MEKNKPVPIVMNIVSVGEVMLQSNTDSVSNLIKQMDEFLPKLKKSRSEVPNYVR